MSRTTAATIGVVLALAVVGVTGDKPSKPVDVPKLTQKPPVVAKPRKEAVASPARVESKRTRSMKCVVTAYCQIPKSSKWTAKQRVGTCATDWNVIPPGSIVHVAGRHLTAQGKHGKRGRVVDIFCPDRDTCMRFGRRVMWARVEKRERR